MTLTKLDNIFNLIAQALPELKFYHFGWLQDVNDNNFINNFNPPSTDPNGINQRLFPALYFLPPEGEFEANFKKNPSRNLYNIQLVFTDLEKRTNDGTPTGKNNSEYYTELQDIAERFLTVFGEILIKSKGKKGVPPFQFKYEFNSNFAKEKLVYLMYSFQFPLSGNDCIDVDDIDIDQLVIDVDGVSDTDSLENNY